MRGRLPTGLRNRRSAVLLALALALALCAQAVQANEQSQALAARAVIALNAGKTAEALELLDAALVADPDDAEARYQRGVVRARGGNADGAIEDLQRALAVRPYFPNAALELGIALVDADRAVDAEAPLLQAQQVPALDAQASFYLGLAQLRLGRMEMAQASLARARQLDPTVTTATQYYEGVIAFRQNDYESAEKAFAAVRSERPDSAMARESAQYVELIAEARAADYSAFGTVAVEYDSNVNLGPAVIADQAGDAGEKPEGDGRVTLNAGARWTPLHVQRFSLSVSYEFLQSLQFDLTGYDLMDNRGALQLQYDFDQVSFGVLGRYDYYLLGGDSFLSEFTAMPWASIREEGIGRTEVYARIQPRDFKGDYGRLSGVYSYGGVRQFFDIGNASQQIWLGYQLGFSAPKDSDNVDQQFNRDQYQFGSQMGEVGIRWPLLWQILGEAAYRYEHQSYGATSGCVPNSNSSPDPSCIPGAPLPTGLSRRADNSHRFILSLERPLPELWEHLSVVAAYLGTFNHSNKSVFEYDRNIGSLGLQVRF